MQSYSENPESYDISAKQQAQSCKYQNDLIHKIKLVSEELLQLPQTRIYPGRNGTGANWYYAHVPHAGENEGKGSPHAGENEGKGCSHAGENEGKGCSHGGENEAVHRRLKKEPDSEADAKKLRTSCHADRYISRRSTPELGAMVNAEALRQLLDVYTDELEAYEAWCNSRERASKVCSTVLDCRGAYYKYLFPPTKNGASNKAIGHIARSASRSDAMERWGTAEYNKSKNHPEGLIHPTLKGDMVRSKSEALIADILFERKIPYRYESEIILDGIVYHPDFTILHPGSGKIVYWEHFGKLDDPDYIHKNADRIATLARNGILPSKNLIISSETRQFPLSRQSICELIDAFLTWDEL